MLGVKGIENLGVKNHVVIKKIWDILHTLSTEHNGTKTIKRHAFAKILATIGISFLPKWVRLQHTRTL